MSRCRRVRCGRQPRKPGVLLASITRAVLCVGVTIMTSTLATTAYAQAVSSAQQLSYFTLVPSAFPVALAPGPNGTIYIAGTAYTFGWSTATSTSTPFLTTPNALQSGPPDGQAQGMFLAILDPSRSGRAQLVYSTFFGGSGFHLSREDFFDTLSSPAVDKAGRAYLCGKTASSDFPLTSGALQASNLFAANPLRDQKQVPPETGFFAVIDPSQSGSAQLVYSTYLGGGNGPAGANAVNIDEKGVAYLTGQTVANDFPLTPNAFQRKQRLFKSDFTDSFTNAFVTVIDPAGSGASSLVYSSYLGGGHLFSTIGQGGGGFPVNQGDAGTAIAPGPRQLVYVAGQAATTDFPVTSGFQSHIVGSLTGGSNEFLTVLNPRSAASRVYPRSQLAYSTYLGGNSFSMAMSVAVDSRGIATIGGQEVSGTGADAFPTTAGTLQRVPAYGGFATTFSKVNPFKQGKASLLYSTLFFPGAFGFSPDSAKGGIAVDSRGFAYAVGFAPQLQGLGFPVTPDAFQPTPSCSPVPNCTPGYVSILDPLASGNASLRYSTFFGDNGDALFLVAPDSTGKVYIAGLGGRDIPTTPGAFSDSANGINGSMFVAILNPPIP